MDRSVLVGTYTTESDSRGIYRIGASGVEFAQEANDPSYLLKSDKGLYWVDEALGQQQGRLCFAARQGGLAVGLPSGGENPCHLALSPGGRWLAVANYTSGSIALYSADERGAPAPVGIFRRAGGSSDPVRQQGAHAHYVSFRDDHTLWCCDLGCDMIRVLECENGIWREVTPFFRLPGGVGPRHMAIVKGMAYVLCELEPMLYTVSVKTRELQSAIRCVPQDAYGYAAAIRAGADGRLYASCRGSDLISVFDIDHYGLPSRVASFPCGGKTPRDILIVGDRLLCACQDSDLVTSFSVARGGGYPQTGAWSVPSPVCLIAEGGSDL